MRGLDKYGKPCLTKFTKANIKKLAALGFINLEGGACLAEMAEQQYFNLNDTVRDDGFPRFKTIKHSRTTEGWASVPLHPNADNLVFGYVDGCFYPILLDDEYTMDDESIFRGDVCHPEYKYLERCGIMPPSKRG